MMSSTFGNTLKITISGTSHGPSLGMKAEGFPAGEVIDLEQLQAFMARRAAAGKRYATGRKEPDVPVFLSGVEQADGGILKILAAPVEAVIENTSQRSGDYNNLRDVPRPGHADFAAMRKDGAEADLRGGGRFSGRMTASLCVAGGMAKQILARRGIQVCAQMISVGGVSGVCGMDAVTGIHQVDEAGMEAMYGEMAAAQAEGDSVGGIIECAVTGLAAGSCGDALFDGLEGRISLAVFGVPAVKGIEFGNGFGCACLKGSENNDPFYVDPADGQVKTRTNHHGGILGGIASGMPVVFRVAMKPTPSIFKEQDSVSMSGGCDAKLKIQGRHDPCIVERAVPCIEAAAAIAVLDALLEEEQ